MIKTFRFRSCRESSRVHKMQFFLISLKGNASVWKFTRVGVLRQSRGNLRASPGGVNGCLVNKTPPQ